MKASEFITEHEMVWARSGGKVKMKWRCTSGTRKGRVVPDPGACDMPIDVEKRAQMKRTRAATKIKQARKAKKTKRINPTSKLITALNKRATAMTKAMRKKKPVQMFKGTKTRGTIKAKKPKKY